MSNAPVTQANERWKDLYFHAMSIVAETQNALGITPDEASCSNGSAEIIAEIKSLKARALKPNALKAKLADCESALTKAEQGLAEQTLRTRDAREDLANYRASAEEQLRERDARIERQRKASAKLHEQITQLNSLLGTAQLQYNEHRQQQLVAVTAERDKLRAFCNAILEYFPDSAPDGFEIQELAEKHGLLKPIEVTEACDAENCQCVELGEFPMDCYRRTKLLTGDL